MKAATLKKTMRLPLLVVVFFLVFVAVLPLPVKAQPETLTVFAAASTTDVVTTLAELFMKANPEPVVTSFASSSTLAKQIENGAPADIFISADQKWMDYLAGKKCIEPDTRVDLLGNRIVLIAAADNKIEKVNIVPGFDLAGLLNQERLAMGDPDHVPAGRYAMEALVKLGIWERVEPLVARAATVRAAMALVERNEAPLGIVYATDAAISRNVKIVGRFPEDAQPAIMYPAAVLIHRNTPAVARFMAFLKSDPARAVFEQAGFTVF